MFELQEKAGIQRASFCSIIPTRKLEGHNYEAAVVTAREAIKMYPYSQYMEDYQITILRARHEYAQRSTLQTQPERYRMVIDEYFNYTNSFPEGKYREEAEKYYKEAQKIIENLPTN